jgi:hypothetical protein
MSRFLHPLKHLLEPAMATDPIKRRFRRVANYLNTGYRHVLVGRSVKIAHWSTKQGIKRDG